MVSFFGFQICVFNMVMLSDTLRTIGNKLWEMLMSILRALVKNLIKENFYGKKKNN